MKHLTENLRILLEEKNKAYEVFRKGYDKACEEFKNKLEELLPYKDKYLHIKDTVKDLEIYLRVDEMFQTKAFSGDRNVILLRGYGFYSNFTEYADATFVHWDFFMEHNIDISGTWNLEEQINNIRIITEEEFNKAFFDMIEHMKQEHL